MYAAPAVVPVSAPRRAGLTAGPLLAVCCLLCILFLIAATIVIALIPIYLPRKQSSLAGQTIPYYFTFSPGQTLPDGELDATAREQIGKQIDAAQGLPVGSTTVNQVLVRRQASRRRRLLNYQRRRRAGKTICIAIAVRNRGVCGLCVPRFPNAPVALSFNFMGISVTVSVTLTIFSSFPSIPTVAFTPSSTAATTPTTVSTATTASTSTSTATTASTSTSTAVHASTAIVG